ncbi:MAG: hypothetical protein JXB32_12150 [Deltaproteobacteria bacterium]|nr:hypothetical protein [Deltaproteobacteria bacterium]
MAALACGCDEHSESATGTGRVGLDVDEFSVALRDLAEVQAHALAGRPADPPAMDVALSDEAGPGALPGDIEVLYGPTGLLTWVSGPDFRVSTEDLGLAPEASPQVVAEAFLGRYRVLFASDDADLALEPRDVRHDVAGWSHVRWRQTVDGAPVLEAEVRVHLDPLGRVRAVDSMLSAGLLPGRPRRLAAVEAVSRALTEASTALETEPVANQAWWDPCVDGAGSGCGAIPVWRVRFRAADGRDLRILVDATDGTIADLRDLSAYILNRSIWDHRNACGAADEECGDDPYHPWPGTCGACSSIWYYLEGSNCHGDGFPPGEGDCDADALAAWDNASTIHGYWWTHLARDGWDDGGGRPMWTRVHVRGWGTGSQAYEDFIVVGQPSLGTHAHEFAHLMWHNDVGYEGGSMWNQYGSLKEGTGDLYGGLVTNGGEVSCGAPPGVRCTAYGNPVHWSQYGATLALRTNGKIVNTGAWVLGQTDFDDDPVAPGTQLDWNGVRTTSLGFPECEKVHHDAQRTWFQTTETFRSYRAHMIGAATARSANSGVQTTNAMDALGLWSPMYAVGGGSTQILVPAGDRFAAVRTTSGGTDALWLFYRKRYPTADAIYMRWWSASGWSTEYRIDDGVNTALSEPVAVVRRWGTYQDVFVGWRGPTDHIIYRVWWDNGGSWSLQPSVDLGGTKTTGSTPAFGALNVGTGIDRVYIVYRGTGGGSNQLYETYVDDPAAPRNLGTNYRSDVAPVLVGFDPADDRLRLYAFFVRPDIATGDDLFYGVLAAGGSWSTPVDLTTLLNGLSGVPTNVTRTRRPVAATVYGITDMRIHLFEVAREDVGSGELWTFNLDETSPGVLNSVGTRPAPQYYTNGESAGGAAPYTTRLFHFFVPKYLYYETQRSD